MQAFRFDGRGPEIGCTECGVGRAEARHVGAAKEGHRARVMNECRVGGYSHTSSRNPSVALGTSIRVAIPRFNRWTGRMLMFGFRWSDSDGRIRMAVFRWPYSDGRMLIRFWCPRRLDVGCLTLV